MQRTDRAAVLAGTGSRGAGKDAGRDLTGVTGDAPSGMRTTGLQTLLRAMLAGLGLAGIGALCTMMIPAPAAHAHSIEAARCQALIRTDFSRTQDAPFAVTNAQIVSQDAIRPYCRVEGYVVPEIGFELRLPLDGWNQGFVLVGSGGWATEKFLFLCKEPLRRGYACIAGDAGHRNGKGLWMRSNPQARIDWGYRATHVVTLAGKALVRAYYDQVPKVSLMFGTSTGGYQALVEAQRFPWDFQGIVAVAPDIDPAGLAMRTAWAARNLAGDDGKPVFTPADLQILHRGALDACDLSDGVRDGIVGDPLGCRFDPRTIRCGPVAMVRCLTQRQVDAAMRIYAGPTTSAGERLTAGGPLPGSELGWLDIAEDTMPDEFFRSALTDAPEDGFAAARFDFDRDYKRLGLAGTAVDDNPDLRRFRQAGGKLLIAQGGSDTTEQPPVLVDYYTMVERVIGSGTATRDFARLFIVPGMNHVTGGDGAFAIDYLAAIERWVVDGQAPAMLIGAHVPDWSHGLRGMVAGLTAPDAAQTVTFTRPVFPYPFHARFRGKGDVDDWRSFRPVSGAKASGSPFP